MVRIVRAAAAVAAMVLAAAAFGAARADAGLLGCRYPQAQRTFAAWGDQGQYVPVPGGSFENGHAGWSFSGGAGIVGGNEPFYLGSTSDSHSLLLPPGSSATTPGVCLSILTPTIRFVGSSSDGSGVQVAISTKTLLGLVQIASFDLMSTGPVWDASSIQNFTLQNLLGLVNLGSSNIYFSFRPVGGATVQMDDLQLDPFLCR